MDNTMSDISRDLLAIFRTEADGRLRAIADNLRRMQAATAPEEQFSHLGAIFSDVQSLRGAAASVDQPDMDVLMQSLEDVLACLRYDGLRLALSGFDILQNALTVSLAVIEDPQGRHAKQVANAVEALTTLAEEGLQSGLLVDDKESVETAPLSLDEPAWTVPTSAPQFAQQDEPQRIELVPLSISSAVSVEEQVSAASELMSSVIPVAQEPLEEQEDTTPELMSSALPVVEEAPAVESIPVVAPVQPVHTMVAPELMDAVRTAFRGEADEHLESLEAGLLALEKAVSEDEQATVLEYTFRSAHSLKGAARAVGLTDVQSVCQAIEHVFAALKRKELRLVSDGFDIMHQALDTVNALLTDAESPEVQQQIDETIGRMQALVEDAQPEELGLFLPAVSTPQAATPQVNEPVVVPVNVVSPSVEVEALRQAAPQPATRSALFARQARQAARSEDATGKATGETIRVATTKLDALLLQAEEMLAIRQAIGERTTELRDLLGSLLKWHKEWTKVSTRARKLQRLYEGTTEQERQAQPYLPLAHDLLEFFFWNESHFSGLESALKNVTRAAERDHKQAGTLIGRLLDDTKKVLMLPFASLLNSFPKMVRDLSRTLSKDVELSMQGTEVEVDKRILDAIKDPLIHLLRNCVDHGIEAQNARTDKGKDTRGIVSISVSQVGVSKVEIVVADDGAGINRAAVVAAAVKKGVLTEQEANVIDERTALGLIFQSDVSTSATVTDLSGRGLGMAIVREKVERLGGQIWVETTPGEGTRFRILLPLTLATFRGFFVETRGSMFVIPTINVERVVRIRPADIKLIEDVETVTLNDRPVGLAYLHNVLDIPTHEQVDPTAGFLRGLVLTSSDRRVLFCVDHIVNEQEVLFKNLGTYLTEVAHVAGVTVLGSGKVVPILDVPNLVRTAIDGAPTRQPRRSEVSIREPEKRSILLAEDSVTSRMLLKGILESAGYAVSTAVDGLDALSQLGRQSFDLVVSDVEMPRMNGFELTAKIRAHEKHMHLPVVLVTGLDSPADRERGMEAGASAYIVKGDFTQDDLLTTVQRFLPMIALAA